MRADEGAGGLVRGDEHPELREALPDLLGDVASDIGTLSGGLAGRLVASNAVWGQFDDGGAPDRRSGLRSSFTLGRTQASQASQLFMDKVAGLFARSTFGVSEVRLEACVRSETRFHEELDDLVNEGVPVLVIRVPILLLNEKFEHMKGDRIGELRELDRGLWRASAGFGEEHVERVSNPSHRERMDGGVERLPHMSEPAGHASDLLLQFVRRRDLRSRLAPFSGTGLFQRLDPLLELSFLHDARIEAGECLADELDRLRRVEIHRRLESDHGVMCRREGFEPISIWIQGFLLAGTPRCDGLKDDVPFCICVERMSKTTIFWRFCQSIS